MIPGNDEFDKVLVRRMSGGDELAFEEFVNRYQDKILNLIYRYTHSRSDAEELVQDVFLKVWHTASSFRAESKVFTWIYRIAVNLSINHLKKKKNVVESLDKPMVLYTGEVRKQVSAPDNLQPDYILEQKEAKLLIENVIQKLPPNQKIAFILSKYEDHSYNEIAEIMKISLPTVKSLLFRAKQNLEKALLPFKQIIS